MQKQPKWFVNFDKDGNWTKPTRTIRVNGIVHDLDQYAAKHGIKLPDSKPQINIDIVTDKDYADLEQPLDSGDTEVDGDGDSEISE